MCAPCFFLLCTSFCSSLSGHYSSTHVTDSWNCDMVSRIRCRLVNEIYGLPIQRRELTLEPNVADLGYIFSPVTPVVLEKECNRSGSVPMSTVQIQFKNVGPRNWVWDLQRLCWFEVGGGCKVQVVAVFEKFQGLGSRWSRCSVDKERVNFDLAGESGVEIRGQDMFSSSSR